MSMIEWMAVGAVVVTVWHLWTWLRWRSELRWREDLDLVNWGRRKEMDRSLAHMKQEYAVELLRLQPPLRVRHETGHPPPAPGEKEAGEWRRGQRPPELAEEQAGDIADAPRPPMGVEEGAPRGDSSSPGADTD